MGADYTISCRCCNERLSEFHITRNYNLMFPFWMLHNHIEDCYESDKRKPFVPMEEYKFLCKTIRKTLQYYCKGNIYNHSFWEKRMKTTKEYHKRHGLIMALIRYYWNLRRYPFDKYKWSCWY